MTGGKLAAEVRAARKALVAVAGVLAAALSAGLLPDPLAGYVPAVLGVLAAAGVYAVPNVDDKHAE